LYSVSALQLVSVERDSEFGPGGIKKWLSIQTSQTVYALGVAESSITLVTAHPPNPISPGTEKSYKYTTLTMGKMSNHLKSEFGNGVGISVKQISQFLSVNSRTGATR